MLHPKKVYEKNVALQYTLAVVANGLENSSGGFVIRNMRTGLKQRNRFTSDNLHNGYNRMEIHLPQNLHRRMLSELDCRFIVYQAIKLLYKPKQRIKSDLYAFSTMVTAGCSERFMIFDILCGFALQFDNIKSAWDGIHWD